MAWPTVDDRDHGAGIPCAEFARGTWEVMDQQTEKLIIRGMEPYIPEITLLTGNDPHKEALLGGLLIQVAVMSANSRERILRGLPVPE